MAKVFISHTKEDGGLAAAIAQALEEAGVTTWHYGRDGFPGPSYLRQIGAAIDHCQVLVVVISNDAIGSEQMTNEIVRGFESKKPLVPLLWGLSHADFQKLQSEWRGAFGAATSIQIPQDGIRLILPRLLGGLRQSGVISNDDEKPPAPKVSVDEVTKVAPLLHPANPPSPQVNLTATFDRTSYPVGEDTLAYWLAELQVTIEGEIVDDGPGADVALVLDVSGSMDKPNRYPLLCAAVRRLALGLGPNDRVSVILFTDRAQTVVPFIRGDVAARNPDRLIQAMNESGLLFGSSTQLAPGLRLALEEFGPSVRSQGRVRRTYVLTDGELHDTPECMHALRDFRPQLAEVHVYGFGDGFDAVALKRLVSDQIGGTVKPILNESDIVRIFAHVAAINRRLIGQGGTFLVTFSPEIACGDAWIFQPTARYLGPVRDRRFEHTFGGIEAGRRYSILLEVRLPSGSEPVGVVEARWIEKGVTTSHKIEVVAPRSIHGSAVPEVRRALDVLEVLRAENETEALLASYKARRELAKLENRDPKLIAALDKMIAVLAKEAAGVEVETQDLPTPLDRLYLESDSSTVQELEIHPLIRDILRELLEIDTDPLSGADALKAAIMIIGGYGRRGEITIFIASYILETYAEKNAKILDALGTSTRKNFFDKYF